MLSEHQCEGCLEGYLLTGRHGIAEETKRFIEAFLASGAGIELAAGHEELVR